MRTDSIAGAGGVFSTWAVWQNAKPEQAEQKCPPDSPGIQDRRGEHNASDLDVLKTKYELLARENELLRQRLAIADRQVEVKDSQINDFKSLSENLSKQNQVLLMLAQGVPLDRILKPFPHDIEVDAHQARPSGSSARNGRNSSHLSDEEKYSVSVKISKYIENGMTQEQVARVLNDEGVSTFSKTGKWSRKRVGNALKFMNKAISGRDTTGSR